MNLLRCFIGPCFLLGTLALPAGATIVTFNGNAYTSSGVAATSNVRAAWGGTNPLLTWDNVLLTGDTGLGASECTGACAPSYTDGSPSTNNVSGQTISGVKFVGGNTTAAGNNVLYVRPLPLPQPSSGPRNTSPYRSLNGMGSFPNWLGGFATAPAVNGIPSITMTLAPNTRSVGFDYASISNLSASSTTGLTITVTTASGPTTLTVGRYDINQSGPNYATSGPGFFGVNSTDDIVTISIAANSSSTQWILNIANFRFGTGAAAAPVPETSSQLTLGAGLIAISLLLRKRSKTSRGGTA